MDTIIVQIQFEQQTDYGLFRDSLNIPKDEYDQIDELEIEERKKNRINKWVAFMESTKNSPSEPTKFTLQRQVISIDSEIVRLNERKSELNSNIESMSISQPRSII